jgi:hypothetical protein
MKVIRVLRPEDVVIRRRTVFSVDHEEAEESLRRAMEATEKLRKFVETRQRALLPESDLRASRVPQSRRA